ncbi:hypothetical protein DITRI_Ditri02bG0006900 [Diplodiscus trichospermus]
MASVSQFNSFPCKSFLTTPQHHNFNSKPSILPVKSIEQTHDSIRKSPQKSIREKLFFQVRAVEDDKWGPQKEEEPVTECGGVAVAEEEKPKEVVEIESLKKVLVDSFYGIDRGLKVTSEKSAEIVELISLLEATNPTPAPTEALPLLNGKWILAYTSFPGLFPLLSRDQLELVKVEEISQTIDAESFTVQNSVQFIGPLASSSISTNAKFEVRSPKRVQVCLLMH